MTLRLSNLAVSYHARACTHVTPRGRSGGGRFSRVCLVARGGHLSRASMCSVPVRGTSAGGGETHDETREQRVTDKSECDTQYTSAPVTHYTGRRRRRRMWGTACESYQRPSPGLTAWLAYDIRRPFPIHLTRRLTAKNNNIRCTLASPAPSHPTQSSSGSPQHLFRQVSYIDRHVFTRVLAILLIFLHTRGRVDVCIFKFILVCTIYTFFLYIYNKHVWERWFFGHDVLNKGFTLLQYIYIITHGIKLLYWI